MRRCQSYPYITDDHQQQGVRELRRVSRGPAMLVLTCDPEVSARMWLMAIYRLDHVTVSYFAGGRQFWRSVMGVAVSSTTVLIRNRPSYVKSYWRPATVYVPPP